MGCCESTCMLTGRELVNGPDFKPLLLHHYDNEEPLKLNVDSTPCKSAVEATPPSGDGTTKSSPDAEAPTESRAWTVQPTSSTEVIQFRRLQYRELTPEDYELLCLLDESLPKKNTAPPSTVTSLPRILASECNTSECHVCLSRLEPYHRVVPLPCGHAFHSECISRWLTQCKGTCPLCNSVLQSDITAPTTIQGKIASPRHAGKDEKTLKFDMSVASEVENCGLSQVDAMAVKMLSSIRRCRCQLSTRADGSFIQPGGGDDPAE